MGGVGLLAALPSSLPPPRPVIRKCLLETPGLLPLRNRRWLLLVVPVAAGLIWAWWHHGAYPHHEGNHVLPPRRLVWQSVNWEQTLNL